MDREVFFSYLERVSSAEGPKRLEVVVGILHEQCVSSPAGQVLGFPEHSFPLFVRLIAILRKDWCEHTCEIADIQSWDRLFSEVLLRSVLTNRYPASWERTIKALLIKDLKKTSPFDGSQGPVRALATAVEQLYDAIVQKDVNAARELVTTDTISIHLYS